MTAHRCTRRLWNGLTRGNALAALLATLLGACSAGSPVVGPAPIPGFEPREMVDVLSPDEIPPIDRPAFAPVAAEPSDEPAIVVRVAGEARAYPTALLLGHEVVRDVIGGVPVAVTFCPRTQSARVYDGRVGGAELRFAASGKLHRRNLVLYDLETTSLWPQLLGVAVAGDRAGQRLRVVPSSVMSLRAFARAHPGGVVLRR